MRLWLATCALGWLGCADGSTTHVPVARVTATPAAVPLHDAWSTTVTLDGSASAENPLDDPTAAQPLLYLWEVDDPRFTAPADLHQPKLDVVVGGEHPAVVRLTVQDADAARATAQIVVGLVVP